MAKLTNPLFSLSASGTIGKNITFSGSLGGPRAFLYTRPAGTGSAARKALYAAGVASWHALTAPQRTAWAATGKLRHITGFNAYIGAWLNGLIGTGTTWDAGATTWDAGATTWDM